MGYLIASIWIMGAAFIIRDLILGMTFLLVAALLTFKYAFLKKGVCGRIHWTDYFSGRSIACMLLSGVSLSMTGYFYESIYYCFGMKLSDFNNVWSYYWDVFVRLDYPNSICNLCFVYKSLAIIFFVLSVVFAVLDKKIAYSKKSQGLLPYDYDEWVE